MAVWFLTASSADITPGKNTVVYERGRSEWNDDRYVDINEEEGIPCNGIYVGLVDYSGEILLFIGE